MLFKADMVRALLAGIKQQTRRLPTPRNCLVDGYATGAKRWSELDIASPDAFVDPGPSPAGNNGPYLKVPARAGDTWHRVYPRVQVGDRIWVRETWGEFVRRPGVPVYRADSDNVLGNSNPWRPAIHMPRWASRITLEITAVRAERLQAISQEDAMCEGVWTAGMAGHDHAGAYRALWEDINGIESWAANPLVWIYDFRRID